MSVTLQLKLARWQQVAQRAVQKVRVGRKLRKVAEELAPDKRYALSWDPRRGVLYLYDSGRHEKLARQLEQVTGMEVVQEHIESEVDPVREVLVKEAFNPLRMVGYVSRAIGGPNPVSDAIAGALTLGTLGYGAGWLGEFLFPKKYVRRGRLRRTLGLAGVALGATPFLLQGLINSIYGDKGPLEAFITPYDQVQMPQEVVDRMNDYSAARGDYVKEQTTPAKKPQSSTPKQKKPSLPLVAPPAKPRKSNLPLVAPPAKPRKSNLPLVAPPAKPRKPSLPLVAPPPSKQASYTPDMIGRPIPVQQFQEAIWNDVQNYAAAGGGPYTPPTAGTVASTIVSDIQQRYGGRSVLSPRHFVRGLLASGADLVTSRLVGGVLSALGGLTPEAQQKLQEMGVWGGMMRGMLGSFGTPGPLGGTTRMVR